MDKENLDDYMFDALSRSSAGGRTRVLSATKVPIQKEGDISKTFSQHNLVRKGLSKSKPGPSVFS